MDLLKFAKKVGKLKRIERSGWVREGIKDPESVADHSCGVAILAMIFAPMFNVDQNKLIKMGLIHDFGEYKTGDIVRFRGGKLDVSIDEKKQILEMQAMVEAFKDLTNIENFIDLYKEIEEGKTEEAGLIKQFDKLDTAVQALKYEKETGKDLSEFFEYADFHIKHPVLKEIMEEIKKERKA